MSEQLEHCLVSTGPANGSKMRTAWTDCPRWLNLMLIALLFVACRTAAAMNWRLALVSVRSA